MIRHVLDTDAFTLFQAGHGPTAGRVAAAAPGAVGVSVITVEEVLTGWYSLVRRSKQPD